MPRGNASFLEADLDRVLDVLEKRGIDPKRVRYRVERTAVTVIPADGEPVTINSIETAASPESESHEWDDLEP